MVAAAAGRWLRNVNGKGDNGGDGDSDGRVRREEAMPPHPLTPAKRRGVRKPIQILTRTSSYTW